MNVHPGDPLDSPERSAAQRGLMMLVIPKKVIGSKGGKAGKTSSNKTGSRGLLSARMESWCRCRVLHGMSQLQSYRAAYPAAKMSDKAAATEIGRASCRERV